MSDEASRKIRHGCPAEAPAHLWKDRRRRVVVLRKQGARQPAESNMHRKHAQNGERGNGHEKPHRTATWKALGCGPLMDRDRNSSPGNESAARCLSPDLAGNSSTIVHDGYHHAPFCGQSKEQMRSLRVVQARRLLQSNARRLNILHAFRVAAHQKQKPCTPLNTEGHILVTDGLHR